MTTPARTPRPTDPASVGGSPGNRVLLVLATSGGGVGAHTRSLATGLAAAGDRVVLAGPPEVLTDVATGSGVLTRVLDVADRPRPRQDLAAVRALARLARTADVVHAHGVRAGALAVLACRVRWPGRRPAVVVTLHNAAVGGARTRAIHAGLEAVVARGADAVLAVSPDLSDRMRAAGAVDVTDALVPSPAGPPPARDRAQVRAELGMDDGTALLVTIARLAPQKGLADWIDAVRLLAAGRPVLAVIAGDGPLHEDLSRRAEGLPVRLLGRRSDVADLFAAADVAVCPSIWEGQPLVVQEALRAGAALVATEVGGTSVVTGDAAVLVPAGEPQALADAVAGLLADDVRRSALQVAARARAARLPTDADAVAQVRAVHGRWVRGG